MSESVNLQSNISNDLSNLSISNNNHLDNNIDNNLDDNIDYWKEFQLGVRSIFQKWTAIRMAIEHKWGGQRSEEKEETLIELIIDLLDKKPDVDRLLDLMEDYVIKEFSMIVEDNSIELVGLDIWEMFCNCSEGNILPSRKLFNSLSSDKQREISDIVGLTKSEEIINNKPKLEKNTNNNNNKQPIIDADGWEIVSHSKKRNKKKK